MHVAGLAADAVGAVLRAGPPPEIVVVEVTRTGGEIPDRPRSRRLFHATRGWSLPRATGPEVDVQATW